MSHGSLSDALGAHPSTVNDSRLSVSAASMCGTRFETLNYAASNLAEPKTTTNNCSLRQGEEVRRRRPIQAHVAVM